MISFDLVHKNIIINYRCLVKGESWHVWQNEHLLLCSVLITVCLNLNRTWTVKRTILSYRTGLMLQSYWPELRVSKIQSHNMCNSEHTPIHSYKFWIDVYPLKKCVTRELEITSLCCRLYPLKTSYKQRLFLYHQVKGLSGVDLCE